MTVRINVKFFVAGEPLTSKPWIAVPRVGDEVMLGPHGHKEPYVVRRVVWGVEGPDDNVYAAGQAVNVDLIRIS